MFNIQNTANIHKLSILSKEIHHHMLTGETLLFSISFMSYLLFLFHNHMIFNIFFSDFELTKSIPQSSSE